MCQFFDKHRRLHFEKERVDITLSIKNIVKLKEIKEKTSVSISELIDGLVEDFLEKRNKLPHQDKLSYNG